MKYILRNLILAIAFCSLSSSWSGAGETLRCRVLKVIDGDSILVLAGNSEMEIRLWGIDSPEYDQPYADKAKKRTAELLKGNSISVKVKGRDGYNRVLAVVYSGGTCVNQKLVMQGAAWVYDYYCRAAECGEWVRLEREARVHRRGLWQDKNPMPPWKWRRLNG